MSGYPYDPNWKDKVTDDCVIALDLDQTCFVSAAGAEKRTIRAIHKASGREQVFKNRTAFWGATKKVVGGWLKDQNTNMEVRAKANGREFTPWGRDDFEIIDVQTAEPVENCLHILKTKINAIFDHLEMSSKNGLGVLGGEGNFRLMLPAPERYKGNREDTLRPLLLQETRDYVTKKYNAKVINGIEADDYLSVVAYDGWLNYKKTGKFSTIVASFDKDQKGNPGLVFDTMRDSEEKTWKHPIPMLIDDSMGEIWMENNKVKGWGRKFFGYQMLCGDSSDNIKPYQGFDIGGRFGDTAAFNLIGHLSDEKAMWQVIIEQYKTWFPEGVEFTSWDEQQVKMTAGQWASVIFQMVYMKKTTNDRTTLGMELRRVGAI